MDSNTYNEWIEYFYKGFDIYSLNNNIKNKKGNNNLNTFPEQLRIIYIIKDTKEENKYKKEEKKKEEEIYIKTESSEVSLNGKLPIKSNIKNDLNDSKDINNLRENLYSLKPFSDNSKYKNNLNINLSLKDISPKKGKKINSQFINCFINKNLNLQSTKEKTFPTNELLLKENNKFNNLTPKEFDFTHKKPFSKSYSQKFIASPKNNKNISPPQNNILSKSDSTLSKLNNRKNLSSFQDLKKKNIINNTPFIKDKNKENFNFINKKKDENFKNKNNKEIKENNKNKFLNKKQNIIKKKPKREFISDIGYFDFNNI